MKRRWWILLTAVLSALIIAAAAMTGMQLRQKPFSALEQVLSPQIRVEAAESKVSSEAEGEENNTEEDPPEEPPEDQPPPEEPPEEEPPEEEPPPEEPPQEPTVVSQDYTEIADGEKTLPGGTGGGEGTGEGEESGEEGGDEPEEEPTLTPTPEPTEAPTQAPEDDTEPVLYTDLRDWPRIITYDMLSDDTLPFQAYMKNDKNHEYSLRIRVKNSQTGMQGTVLKSADGISYEAVLARRETTEIDILIRKNGKTVQTVPFYFTYQEKDADRDNPTVGEQPPTIVTRLDTEQGEGAGRDYEFWVQAWDYNNSRIYSSSIEVLLNGIPQRSVSDEGDRYTYTLHFDPPVEGDTVQYEISVRAWDNEGNQRFVLYHYTYHDLAEGEIIGKAYVILDASVVGIGLLESEAAIVDIRQGEPASYAVKAALEYFQYDLLSAGSLDQGFYIRRISRPGAFFGAEIPELLRTLLERDNLSFTEQYDEDSLGEYDYTMSSGWMFSVGGEVYSGKGLSSYYLSDGDTLYLRFTLSYGKDVGGSSTQGGKYTHYCASWLNGQEFVNHQWTEEQVLQEPTCTEPGYKSAECAICGTEAGHVEIPAKGHDYEETGRTEPQPGVPGEIRYRCRNCGDEYTEIIPALPVEDTPTPTPDPTDTPTPTPDPTDTPTPDPMDTPTPDPTDTPAPAPGADTPGSKRGNDL